MTVSRRQALKCIGGGLGLCVGASVIGSAAATAGATTYPLRVTHAFGTTVIEEPPARVASQGFLEHDTLLALGSVPIGIRGWFAQLPHATGPWAAHLLDGHSPASLAGSELPYEMLLDLQPDLIVAIYTNLTQEEYDRLATIAPTIAWKREVGPWGTYWEDNVRLLGRILDRQRAAEALIAGVHDSFRSIRERYPQFSGAYGIAGNSASGTFVIRGPRYDTGSLLTGLGITYPPDILRRLGGSPLAHFSWEQAHVISRDLDLILWDVHGGEDVPAMARRMEMLGVYPGEGRIVFNDATSLVSMAMASQSVLSFPYAAEMIAPRLAAALDGHAPVPAD